ncbi:MAG: esterase-like activity of phytase family protein, partial [Allosphingosinicella sp.]
FLLLAWLALATVTPHRAVPVVPPPAAAWVRFEPVALDAADPRRTALGPFIYLGGWALSSNDPRFGGLSALHVEGGAVLAFSDAGWRVRFPVPRGAVGTMRAEVGPLPAGPGSGLRKTDRDIESMWAEGDRIWLGFERRNAVWRYDRRTWRASAAAAPPAMARWPRNRGPEAMVRLADGRFLVFAEGSGGGGDALLFAGDPAIPGTPAIRLFYAAPAHYRATDAALLPDGRILILNRRWTFLQGFTAKLTIVALGGPVLQGREVADLRPPLVVDNMEGLSIAREGGRTIVWIASDDNYMPLQRTLLLKFALPREKGEENPRPSR